ncbi:hypothetical protein ABEB36_013006 [Hypothenemus hampei]
MTTFPRDIVTAEERTNGNPNILSEPEFLPNKKINYDEIFGSVTPKKSVKKNQSPSLKKPKEIITNPLVTHRRFLGNDDYKAYILPQRSLSNGLDNTQQLDKDREEVLSCLNCSFSTTRIGVMKMHNKLHLEGLCVPVKKKIKKFKDLGESDGEGSKDKTPKLRKKRPKKNEKTTEDFSNLLEEWEDTDEEGGSVKTTVKSKKKKLETHKAKISIKPEEGTPVNSKQASSTKNTHEDIKNCFDFDEEEEEDDILLPASTGRKIPRVIPEKPKASISELLELSEKEDAAHVEENFKDTSETLNDAFKELMEDTKVPHLDDLTENLKPEQNFHDARTVKFPDKDGTSKKVFVTSFDDFEAGFRKIDEGERMRETNKCEETPNVRKSKQLIIDDDSERIIDFTKDLNECNSKQEQDLEDPIIEQTSSTKKKGRPKKSSNQSDCEINDVTALEETNDSLKPLRRGRSRKVDDQLQENFAGLAPPSRNRRNKHSQQEEVPYGENKKSDNEISKETIPQPSDEVNKEIQEPLHNNGECVSKDEEDKIEEMSESSITQDKGLKQDFALVTGIVSDVIYGKNSQLTRSKSAKSRWDIVPPPDEEDSEEVKPIEDVKYKRGRPRRSARFEETASKVLESEQINEELHEKAEEEAFLKQGRRGRRKKVEEDVTPTDLIVEKIEKESEELGKVDSMTSKKELEKELCVKVDKEETDNNVDKECDKEKSNGETLKEVVEKSKIEDSKEKSDISELILPLKKSKRANDALKEENEPPKPPIEETSNVKDSIQNIDLNNTEEDNLNQCVPPKKKKLESIEQQEDEQDNYPQAPKKKMQKLYENSQTESPLMSPLTKKKTFQFQSEETTSCKLEEEAPKIGEIENEAEPMAQLETNTPELVALSVTPTVMTEQDLANAQVEITTDKVISKKLEPVAKIEAEDMKIQPASPALSNSPKQEKKKITSRSELLDILEDNSSFKQLDSNKTAVPIDFEDAIPSQIVLSNKSVLVDSPKLLERLSMTTETSKKTKVVIQSDIKVPEALSKTLVSKIVKPSIPKPGQRIVIRAPKSLTSTASKPIILSEQIIKPANNAVQGVKRQYEDVEDMEAAFIIPKMAKKSQDDQQKGRKVIGKAKILQQTIITPKGEVIPHETKPQTDDSMFDINSMPIVLSDDILSAETIQNMPVMLSEDVVQVAKNTQGTPKQIVLKTSVPSSLGKITPKNTVPAKTTAFLATGTTADGKPAKYVLVPPCVTPATTQVKTVKQAVIKKQPAPSEASQGVGNKIMIVTNAQGQQTRVVLTPQQQKVFMQPGSKTKTIIKGAIPKALLEGAGNKPTIITQQSSIGTSLENRQLSLAKTIKAPVPKKVVQKTPSKPQKTILIKNQLGQTVRKIQGTDDADLDRQVAEQLEAIKASARLQQSNKAPEIINFTNRAIPNSKPSTIRKSYAKKSSDNIKTPAKSPTVPTVQTQEGVSSKVPALAPLSPQSRLIQQTQSNNSGAQTSRQTTIVKKPVAEQNQVRIPQKSATKEVGNGTKRSESPVKQVVIQDGLGNLTTVTVGQILAIPSETVDGQPQSYMLVTVDETGNLTPLNNDALMSLDPSLGAGGDVNNMVLQMDQGQGTLSAAVKAPPVPVTTPVVEKKVESPVKMTSKREQQMVIGEETSTGGDGTGQQLIVTGDPIATQKFLESLSDGSTDLASILASAEGGSVILQTEGQQILIRTNPSGQHMVTEDAATTDLMYGAHKPNQDILAAALANTDVFQATEQATVKGLSPQLSPSSGTGIFPMQVGNVLETSLTLTSPIMTPLEVPSTNSKKIDDEADILSQVPKNVDLPITITDPNISQTVANNQQQQGAGLMQLTLPIPDSGPVSGSSEINSPGSFSYTLPLVDSVSMTPKSFNSNMPLLTEDVVEGGSAEVKGSGFSPNFDSLLDESARVEVVKTSTYGDITSLQILTDDVVEDSGSSIDSTKLIERTVTPKQMERDIVDEGLSTLGGEMCSSLSEPPPDMFDLSAIIKKEEPCMSDMEHSESLSTNSENSEEIPLQPPIVATLSDLKGTEDEKSSDGSDGKRAKLDSV